VGSVGVALTVAVALLVAALAAAAIVAAVEAFGAVVATGVAAAPLLDADQPGAALCLADAAAIAADVMAGDGARRADGAGDRGERRPGGGPGKPAARAGGEQLLRDGVEAIGVHRVSPTQAAARRPARVSDGSTST
jgi:hypothetical protein